MYTIYSARIKLSQKVPKDSSERLPSTGLFAVLADQRDNGLIAMLYLHLRLLFLRFFVHLRRSNTLSLKEGCQMVQMKGLILDCDVFYVIEHSNMLSRYQCRISSITLWLNTYDHNLLQYPTAADSFGGFISSLAQKDCTTLRVKESQGSEKECWECRGNLPPSQAPSRRRYQSAGSSDVCPTPTSCEPATAFLFDSLLFLMIVWFRNDLRTSQFPMIES